MSVFSELVNESGFDPGAPGPEAEFIAWGYELPEQAERPGQWLLDMVSENLDGTMELKLVPVAVDSALFLEADDAR